MIPTNKNTNAKTHAILVETIQYKTEEFNGEHE